jgi:hypothetical protein
MRPEDPEEKTHAVTCPALRFLSSPPREKALVEPVRVRQDVVEDVEIARDHGAVLSAARSPTAGT